MPWTCPHCNETIEEPATGSIQFCLHCGEPTQTDAKAASPDRLDSILRVVMIASGVVWLVLFFIPFGQASYGSVMSWDLLADHEGMSYLVSWPLMLGILFLVLGAVGPFPPWLRSGTAVLLGGAFLILMGSEDPGGPLGADIQFVFMGDAVWILIFPIIGAGLMHRIQSPRSVVARVFIGLALLFGLVAYLTGAEGESTLVGSLLRYLGDDETVRAIGRVFLLLPLFWRKRPRPLLGPGALLGVALLPACLPAALRPDAHRHLGERLLLPDFPETGLLHRRAVGHVDALHRLAFRLPAHPDPGPN